jgi:hypothetical protein
MRSKDGVRKDQARTVSRICGAYMLRGLLSIAGLTGGDLTLAIIYAAITQANLQPLSDDPALSSQYGALGAAPPDEIRRPISVHALAASLSMPYETTRRAVERLIAMDRVRRVSRTGVIATREADDSLEGRRAVEQTQIDAARMMDQLRRHGVEI